MRASGPGTAHETQARYHPSRCIFNRDRFHGCRLTPLVVGLDWDQRFERESIVPIITISRGTLSGGRRVAECLAGALAYPCVGREILQEAARTVGVSVEDLSEKLEATPR